nr:hypothetical protein [Tanacetum cinerariifolium]
MANACGRSHVYIYPQGSARIRWNSHKAGSILNYNDLKAKFRSHFSQQKRFTKTHLAVHIIKQRQGESVRAFATRYTDDTLQILGLHEDQRIFGFVHGLKTRNLVEHLSTYLLSTYKGLMEKTYIWIEAKEVATNGASNYRKDNFESLSKSPREILSTEKVARSFEQPPRILGSRRSRDMSNQRGEKKEKNTTPAEAPILMINQDEACTRNSISKSPTFEGREITFPSVTKDSNSSAPVVIKSKIFEKEPSIQAYKVDSQLPLVGFSGEKSWAIGEVLLEITINDAPLSRRETLSFVIVRRRCKENQRYILANTKGVLSCTNAKEKIIVNNKYPEQTVTIKKQLPEHFKERIIAVNEKPFNTEHKLNEYSHVKPIKQKRRSLGLERSTTARKEVEELTRARILREATHQTLTANPVMVKKSEKGWRICVDFTDINKACSKDCYHLPDIDLCHTPKRGMDGNTCPGA